MTEDASRTLGDCFPWAVVRVASFGLARDVPSRLLFGSVSLLTPDRPKPVGGVGVGQHKIGPTGARVFMRRVVMTGADALAWYRSIGGSDFQTPIPTDPDERDKRLDGRPLVSGIFSDNPEWPLLALPLAEGLFGPDAGDPAPFMGSVPSRIHRRLGDAAGFEKVKDAPDAVLFLKRRLHIDLVNYPEYLGGLALVVPDPIILRIDHFLIPRQGPEPEKVMRRLVARPGQSLAGLRMTILEKRANLLTRFETLDVPTDGVVVIHQNLPAEESGYLVTHPDRGLLVYGAPAGFIRSIVLNMGIVGRTVNVEAPTTDSPTSALERYQVSEIAQESPIVIGEGSANETAGRVAQAEARRMRQAQARRYDQTWFEDGNRKKALDFIRVRMGRARHRIRVADPYFGAAQVGQFLHAVPRTNVEIQILTSRLAFAFNPYGEAGFSSKEKQEGALPITAKEVTAGSTRNAADTGKQRRFEQQRLQAFERSLATFDTRGIQDVSVLVMIGRPPPLHDRFLVVGDTVWFMGHSFNALGDRGSLILQVPDPTPILEQLDCMIKRATAFAAYAKARYSSFGKGPKRTRKKP